jgi:hypothetical protein
MRSLLPLCLLLAGCSVLFPEFNTPSTDDAGASDAGALPHVAGAVCSLSDLRDLRSCALGPHGSFRVTIEETHDAALADASGNFNVPTMSALATATLSVVDSTGAFVPTVTVVHPTAGVVDNFAVPVVGTDQQQQLALAAGTAVDPTRGGLLAWTVDATGAPMAGVRATAIAGAVGPLYDGDSQSSLVASSSTGAHGVVGQLDVTPGTVALALSTSTTTTTFMLPVRAGAMTLMALTLPQ